MDLNSSPTTSSISSPETIQPQTQPVQAETMQSLTPVQQQEMLDIGQARDFHLMVSFKLYLKKQKRRLN